MTASLYIHIPFCLKKCDYCDFFSKPQSGKISDAYVEALINEAEFHAERFGITHWKTIYLGGGTPGLLSAQQTEHLFNQLSPHITEKTEEITMEMNPESVTEEKLVAAKKAGVTRLSLGIQSFNDKALKTVNRHCTSTKARESLELIKSNWDGQLNLDCIAGLPGQNLNEFITSLNEIISFNPDHISMYTLTVEEGTPLYKKIEEGIIEHDPDKADEHWMKGRELLEAKGYIQYEVSNFSKPGKESRHNMTYWMQQDYSGIGAGATGTVYGTKSLRWTNTQDIEKYIQFWTNTGNLLESAIPREIEEIDSDTREFEFLMMGFRTTMGVNSARYKKLFSEIGPWYGDLSERLGEKNGSWNRFSTENLTEQKKETDGSTTYALNKNGLLFLNKFLIELL